MQILLPKVGVWGCSRAGLKCPDFGNWNVGKYATVYFHMDDLKPFSFSSQEGAKATYFKEAPGAKCKISNRAIYNTMFCAPGMIMY